MFGPGPQENTVAIARRRLCRLGRFLFVCLFLVAYYRSRHQMILVAIIGTIICGAFPLLFIRFFQRMEKERLATPDFEMAARLAQLQSEFQMVESHLSDLRHRAAATDVSERAF